MEGVWFSHASEFCISTHGSRKDCFPLLLLQVSGIFYSYFLLKHCVLAAAKAEDIDRGVPMLLLGLKNSKAPGYRVLLLHSG